MAPCATRSIRTRGCPRSRGRIRSTVLTSSSRDGTAEPSAPRPMFLGGRPGAAVAAPSAHHGERQRGALRSRLPAAWPAARRSTRYRSRRSPSRQANISGRPRPRSSRLSAGWRAALKSPQSRISVVRQPSPDVQGYAYQAVVARGAMLDGVGHRLGDAEPKSLVAARSQPRSRAASPPNARGRRSAGRFGPQPDLAVQLLGLHVR
jgi:hypothetical protein